MFTFSIKKVIIATIMISLALFTVEAIIQEDLCDTLIQQRESLSI